MTACWSGKALVPPPLGPEAGEQVGRDDDVAHGGDVVGHGARPVGEAEDFVDEQDDGRFVADFGIDNEGVDGAAAVVDFDPFLMARRFVEDGFGPVLCGGGRGDGAKKRVRRRG